MTEQYHQMCATHPEIQGLWKKKRGDRYYFKGYWQPQDFVEIGEIRMLGKNPAITIEDEIKDWWECFWLPRIEDLVEMVAEPLRYETSVVSLNLTYRFARFCGIDDQDAEGCSNVSIRKGSMPELWIAFVSHELWQLKWNKGNKKWI